MGALRALSGPLRGVIGCRLSVIEAAARRYLLSVIGYLGREAGRFACYLGRCAALSVICYLVFRFSH